MTILEMRGLLRLSRRASGRAGSWPARRSWAGSSRMLGSEGLSFRTGPSEPPLYGGTIPEHFAQIVSQHGDRPAVITRSPTPGSFETSLTYYMLDILSNRLASSLASLGVEKGDRVAISQGNTPEFAALTYACFKLGAVLVPLNPGFNAQQVEAALRHLGAEVLIAGAVTDLAYKPGRGRSNEELLSKVAGDLRGGTIQSAAVPTLKTVVVVDNRVSHNHVRFKLDECRALTPYRTLLGGSERGVTPSQRLDTHDTINIQFTSGTTSTPKAAMLTHHSILNNGILIAHRMGLDPSDKMVVPPPLFHCFGCILGYMATATTGSAILFPSPAFDPVATLNMCVDHDATGLYGVSTMLGAVLEAIDSNSSNNSHDVAISRPPAHLRKGIVAGSSVPEALMKTIYKRLGLQDLVICYGMTETSPVSCMTSPSDPFHQRCASVGTPMPHTSIKIVEPSDRSVILPINTPGELAAAGYLVMKGYFNDAAKTSHVRVSEPSTLEHPGNTTTTWLYSGDEASMDKDGFVTITGRIKDLIIRGGENIHPLEIENCLFQLPGVNQASVVGVPDEKLGETIVAFVIPHREWTPRADDDDDDAHDPKVLTVKALQEWVRTNLSAHLVPKHVFWLDEFPKTASGKIQKFKLKDLAMHLLNKSGE